MRTLTRYTAVILLTTGLGTMARAQEPSDQPTPAVDMQPDRSPYPVRAGAYADDYAALNAEREGVEILPNGVQYEVLQQGSGRQATADATVAVRYRATIANGVEFDTTYDEKEPALLQINEVVARGLRETLPLMREGDKWRITIPAPLGFTGGRMLRRRDLIYELELVSVQSPALPPGPGGG